MSFSKTWFHILLLLMGCAPVLRADWQEQLSDPGPGAFAALRPVTVEYVCGWAGLTAGQVEAQFSRPAPGICLLEAKGSTVGLARALWRLDATHVARADDQTLMPSTVRQKEVYRSQTVRTLLAFDDHGVDHFRESTAEKNPPRHKRFDFPDLRDLQTALLYVRSQKLENGDVYRFVVFPATSPYLATVTVEGREKVKVRTGTYPAIKMDLKLEKVTSDLKLAPHGKFKRATGWLSDDSDRLPLKMNAQIFIGSVWLELTKVTDGVPEPLALNP
ncbi:MAG TPA: DUF3108 domain-containing protein [Chthoniobacteraceae bacterium]|jgi:hypothetical protein|nr:DUF3108 domain-containing protein [Chthoniobacteraceae bacterium]